jgi:choline transport protein
MAYFAYLVPVWVSAPVATHSQVWTTFENEGGWSSLPLAVLVGQLTGIGAQVGVDTVSHPSAWTMASLTMQQAAHMSEEVKNASKVIPTTILVVYVLNFVLMFPAILTVCYHIPSLNDALGDPTTYPAIYVLRQSMSTTWITVVLAVIVAIMCVSSINYFAAVNRDLFAFARDQGLPFSSWLGKVHPTKHLPVNASQVSSVIAGLLCLIYIGSPVAFYAITSLLTVSLLMCYIMSIGSILWRKVYRPYTIPPSRFELGRVWGIVCNGLAIIYGSWACFWSFWPTSTPVTAAGFNWASPIFGAVLVFSLFYYWFIARNSYTGPVAKVVGRSLD